METIYRLKGNVTTNCTHFMLSNYDFCSRIMLFYSLEVGIFAYKSHIPMIFNSSYYGSTSYKIVVTLDKKRCACHVTKCQIHSILDISHCMALRQVYNSTPILTALVCCLIISAYRPVQPAMFYFITLSVDSFECVTKKF